MLAIMANNNIARVWRVVSGVIEATETKLL